MSEVASAKAVCTRCGRKFVTPPDDMLDHYHHAHDARWPHIECGGSVRWLEALNEPQHTGDMTKGAPVTVCRNRAEVSDALARLRQYRGMTQLELDDRAGFSDGYAGKLEVPFAPPASEGKRPSGRCAMHAMFDIWLGALNACIIVIPGEDADAYALAMAGQAMRRSKAKSHKESVRCASRLRKAG